jgi:NAD(P)H-flavin reductase
MVVKLEQPMSSQMVSEPMVPRAFRIHRSRQETADTFTIDLVPAEGTEIFRFAPGQFNMLYLLGVGEVPMSISGYPNVSAPLQHTTRALGSVTKAIAKLKPGDTIGVRGPFGHAWPLEAAVGQDCVIVAGGIGLAPLRPVLYHVIEHRADYRRIFLFYGARTPSDILYRRELERWRGKFDLDIQVTVDSAGRDWRGNVGVVTSLIGRAPFDPTRTVALVCGPEVMMRFSLLELQKRGVPADHAYVSMERNMKCAVGFCGHCQYGPMFICKDGPVFRCDRIATFFGKAEI